MQTQLLDESGREIEAVKFADVRLNPDVAVTALQSSYDTSGFRWISEPRRGTMRPIGDSWRSEGLPPGFRRLSTHEEQIPGHDGFVTHISFSDGLANVSVFVEPHGGNKAAESSRMGASNTFSMAVGQFRVTAVGEVPLATVEQIARSMQFE